VSAGGASTGALITDEREILEEEEPSTGTVEPPAAPVDGAEPETPVAEATGETETPDAVVPQKSPEAEEAPELGVRRPGEESGQGPEERR
jgi:hypothetical protein